MKLNTYNERVKTLCLEYYKNHQVKSIQMLNDFKILGVGREAVQNTGLIVNNLIMCCVLNLIQCNISKSGMLCNVCN